MNQNNQNIKKGAFPYALLLFIGLALLLFYKSLNKNNKVVTYNEFNKALNNNKV